MIWKDPLSVNISGESEVNESVKALDKKANTAERSIWSKFEMRIWKLSSANSILDKKIMEARSFDQHIPTVQSTLSLLKI